MSAARPMLTRHRRRRRPRAVSASNSSSDAYGLASARTRDLEGHLAERWASWPGRSQAGQTRPSRERDGLAFQYFPRHKPGGKAHARQLQQEGMAEAGRNPRRATTRTPGPTSATTTSQEGEEIRRGSRAQLELPAEAVPPQAASRSATTRTRARGTPTSRSPGRPTATRTPPRCSTSSTTGTTTCWRSRSASPRRPATSSGSTAPARARATTPFAPRPTTAPTPTARPARRQPRRQRQHGHAAGRPRADDADVPAARAGHDATPTATRSRRPTWATRPTRSTTSTPTACPNRLVVDADGRSTLGGVQAGAMGEAWSDWYAMDYLVAKELQSDKPGKVDVVLFQYDGEGVFLDRTEPIDCKVGATVSALPRAAAPVTPAATPTPTTARSAAAPRCTPTARSGPRRSGTCATASAQG